MANKKYSDDFKKKIVSLYASGKSVAFLSKEYNVPRENIYVWIRNAKQKEDPKDGESVTIEEFRKMKKRLEQAELENEILKKAVLIIGEK